MAADGADTPHPVVFVGRGLDCFRIHFISLAAREITTWPESRRVPGSLRFVSHAPGEIKPYRPGVASENLHSPNSPNSPCNAQGASRSLLILPSLFPFVICFSSLFSCIQLPFVVQSCHRQIFDRLSIRSLRSFRESCLLNTLVK